MRRPRHVLRLPATGALLGLFIACSPDEGPTDPSKAQGLSLTRAGYPPAATVGSSVPLAVTVMNGGVRSPGVRVTWFATGGRVNEFSYSDSAGIARATWEMPRAAGKMTLEASVPSANDSRVATNFPMIANPDTAMYILRSSGDGETAVNSCYRVFTLAVVVLDRFDNRLPPSLAVWRIMEGPVVAAPSAPGSSEAMFLAQQSVGVARVRATIRSGAYAEFTLTVLPPRYEIGLIDNDYGGDPYFESGQTCGGIDSAPVDTVPAGATVTWSNRTHTPMRLIFPAGAPAAESSAVPPYEKYSLVFPSAGTYEYAEMRSSRIRGTIVVR